MKQDETEIVLHTMKGIANKEREFMQYVNQMLEQMCRELNLQMPDRRNGVDRRNVVSGGG